MRITRILLAVICTALLASCKDRKTYRPVGAWATVESRPGTVLICDLKDVKPDMTNVVFTVWGSGGATQIEAKIVWDWVAF